LTLLFPFARGWVGAGDVKLLGAIGAWLGPEGTLHCALAGAVLGGVLALVYLLKADPAHRRVVFTNLRLSLYLRSVPELEPRPARLSPSPTRPNRTELMRGRARGLMKIHELLLDLSADTPRADARAAGRAHQTPLVPWPGQQRFRDTRALGHIGVYGDAKWDFNGHWGSQEHLDHFIQAYAVEKARIEARKRGHTITEHKLADGSIKLTVQVQGGTV